MTPRLITPPAIEPVSVAELKEQLAITHADEDMRLVMLLVVARTVVERMTRRRLNTQTWRLTLDGLGDGRVLRLPVPPVQTVTAVRVADAAGVFSVFPASNYLLDLSEEPARLVFTGDVPAPGRTVAGIEVDVVAGYGATADAVPAALRQAVMLLACRWYRHRGTEPDGTIPADVGAIIESYRVVGLAA